jgi:hypothetical protein
MDTVSAEDLLSLGLSNTAVVRSLVDYRLAQMESLWEARAYHDGVSNEAVNRVISTLSEHWANGRFPRALYDRLRSEVDDG